MAFDQSAITDGPTFARSGNDLVVAWTSSAAPGTTFQLYINRALVWNGTQRKVFLPWPTGPINVAVGTVLASEASADFSGSLPAIAADRARLDRDGGTWEAADIAGYYVYASPAPGAAVSYAAPVATIPFAVGPNTYDGYGRGGYGSGGYGSGDAHFTWTSGRLAAGVWAFTVAPFDAAGNVQASHLTATVSIAGPPLPPAPDSAFRRLTYTMAAGRVPTLHWLASPSL